VGRRWSLFALCVLVACAADPGVRSRHADSNGPIPPITSDPGSTTPGTGPGSTVPVPGAQGVGDALFPDLGNPGLDVTHYDVALSYVPGSGLVEGVVTLDIVLTTARDTITLDSLGPTISEVTVDGDAVPYEPQPPELFIDIPDSSAGDQLQVLVRYEVRPQPVASDAGISLGWFETDGGSFVLSEPEGARYWLPSNDHPSDKASYTFHITVPVGTVAVANGELTDRHVALTNETFVWQEERPMATYLVQVLTGDYVLVDATGPHGLPLSSVVLNADRELAQPSLDLISEQVAFFETQFGPYPLDRYGIAITDSFAGLAMETQERSMFSRDDVLGPYPPTDLYAHELAHQWFGDAVSVEEWGDIWLNESFASYAAWLWLEHEGESLDALADSALAARYPGATATPSVPEMFAYNSYEGGAVVLHALRKEIGDDAFFTLLRRWVADNNGTARNTTDFIALAEEVAGRSLTDFFATWLFAATVPSQYPR
jgi:aminopeptidase N